MLDKSIRKLGEHIRHQVEVWTKDNLDIDQDNLGGACAIATYTLYRSLIKLGYKPKFIVASSNDEDHCWVELDEFVIDLTATQFNMALPKVLITNKKYYTDAIPKMQSFSQHSINSKAVSYTKEWEYQSPVMYFSEIKKFIRGLDRNKYAKA